MSEARVALGSERLRDPAATLALVGSLAVFAWLLASGAWALSLIGFALLAAFVGARWQWLLAPLGALAFFVPVPFTMWYSLTGEGTLSLLSRIHPGTLYLLALTAFGWRPSADGQPPVVLATVPGERLLAGLQVAFVAIAGGMSVALRGLRGLSLLLDNYVGPFTLFWLLVWLFRSRSPSRNLVGSLAATLGILFGILAVLEFAGGRNPVYEPFYGEVPWFPYPTGEYRSTVSFGAPLAAANVFLAILVVLTAARSIRLRAVGVLLLIAGVLATGSRSAVALAVVTSPFVVLAIGETASAQHRPGLTRQLAIGVGILGAIVSLVATPLGSVVLHRVLGSWQSTAVRVLSVEYFRQSVGSYLTHGVGLGGSTDVSTAALGSYVTFENPWIMLAVDVGIPLATFYACVLALVFVIALRHPPRRWGALVGVLGLVLMESAYNSFGVRSLAGYDLWMVLAVLWPDSTSYKSTTL